MMGSSQERTGDTQGGVWDARERGFQRPLWLLLLILFLQKQEKYYIIICPVHNLFTESSIFPLAFFLRLEYYVLALKESEC